MIICIKKKKQKGDASLYASFHFLKVPRPPYSLLLTVVYVKLS